MPVGGTAIRLGLLDLLVLLSGPPVWSGSESAPSAETPITEAILGGGPAAQGEFPWMAALIHRGSTLNSERQFCGAVLIEPTWVLTAAHCISDLPLNDFLVAIGVANLNGKPRLIRAKLVLVHPEAHHRPARGTDLALIQLSEPVDDIRPLALWRGDDQPGLPELGTLLGWGRTSTDPEGADKTARLQVVEVPIHPLDGAILLEVGLKDLPPGYIPTGTIDPAAGSAPGDSGGPLLIRDPDNGEWLLAGINNLGYHPGQSSLVGLSVYTDVGYHHAWIEEMTGLGPAGTRIEANGFPRPEDFVIASRGADPSVRVWPFASGALQELEFSNDLRTWHRFSFAMRQANAYRFNPDGSLTVSPASQFDLNGPLFIRDTRDGGTGVRTGAFPFYPHQVVRGTSRAVTASHGQSQVVYRLEDLEAGQPYVVTWSDQINYTHIRFQKETDGRLRDIPVVVGRSIEFRAEPDAQYWVTVTDLNPHSDQEFALYAHKDTAKEALPDVFHAGGLDLKDTPLKRAGVVMDTYRIAGLSHGEYQIDLYSEFDAEMEVVNPQTGQLIGYYDEEGPEETETFIAYWGDLLESDFRIYNFDPSSFGNYNFRIMSHPNTRSVEVGTETQRALTRADLLYTDNDGLNSFYEWIEILRASEYSSITVTVEGLSGFEPFAGIADASAEQYVATDHGGLVTLVFPPVTGSTYGLVVSAPDDALNQNYVVKIAGDPRNGPDAGQDDTP